MAADTSIGQDADSRPRYNWGDAWADKGSPAAPTPQPWDGRPPDARESAYLARALDDEAAAVATTTQGSRNDALNRAAFNCGQLVAGAGMDEAEAWQRLAEAGRACGLTGSEIGKTLRSGLESGKASPRRIPPATSSFAPNVEVVEVGPAPDAHAYLVADRVRQLRVDRDAREILAAERRPAAEPFDAGTLAEILARPAEPAQRVDGLIPWRGSTLVAAQRKTGKTTFVLNLARSLITGAPFLGSCATRTVKGRVCLLNYEVSGAQVARWADQAGVPDGRLFLVNLRGRRNPLAHPEDRQTLARVLRAQEVETLIVDPFGRAYTGASQNDAGEVGSWLVDLDTFARSEVGALDLVLTAHAGWNAERTRGSSALEDWPDSIITLTRDPATDERFLSATGRDVDHDEDRLDYDHGSRRLTLAGVGSRTRAAHTRRSEGLSAAVVDLVAARPGLNTTELAQALRDAGHGVQRGETGKAARAAQEAGLIRSESGKRGAVRYFPSDLSRPIPTYPDGIPRPIPTRPIEDGIGQGQLEGPPIPDPCRVCGQPLHPVVIADGFDTCPGCEATR